MAGLGKQLRGTGIARVGFAKGSFPDLTGDGKVTRADILKGRGVLKKGGMAQQAAIAISKKESGKYNKDGMRMKKGGSAKPGLWANINRRKKLGISRPKSKSTISAKAYSNMKKGFPK